jgi:hypothetical protein
MNGFLVLVQCWDDNVPIGLYATRDEANRAVRETLDNPEEWMEDWEDSSLFRVFMIEFWDGRPVGEGFEWGSLCVRE